MSLELDDLTTPLTVAQVTESIYNILSYLGVQTTVWKPGAVVRTIIAAFAIVVASCSQLIALIASGGFLTLARGAWKTLVARYVYGIDRYDATFAAGDIELTNAGAGVFTFEPGELIFRNSETLKQYYNTQEVNLNATETITVAISAFEVGSGSTSAAGAIDELLPPIEDISCTNAIAIVGLDEESDNDLELRCLASTGASSPYGPKDAFAFAARNAKRTDGTSVGVTRVNVISDGFGHVTTIVAGASGGITGDQDDPETDLGAVHSAIVLGAEPQGITPVTESAETLAFPVTYSSWYRNPGNVAKATIATAVSTALINHIKAIPIGGDKVAGVGIISRGVLQDVIDTTINATLAANSTGSARTGVVQTIVSVPSALSTEILSNQAPVASDITGTLHPQAETVL